MRFSKVSKSYNYTNIFYYFIWGKPALRILTYFRFS